MKPIASPSVERILLATDFSEWSTTAVEYGFEMARSLDAELLMVHGIEPISDAAVDEQEEDDEFDEFFEELVDQARDKLETLVDRAEARDVRARFHIEIGQRAGIILEYADSEDVDLIVLGRRSRDDQPDFSLGTTSQRVFYGTERPVLTVPADTPSGRESEPQRA